MNTCSHSLPFCFNWFSRRSLFCGGACNARQDVHAGLVCDLCESVLCVFLCDMPCARVVFGTSVFHFKRETGGDPGGSRVESSCSVELLWDPKDSAVRCRRVLTRWWFLLRTLYCRASLHFAVTRTTATFTPPFGVCVLYGVGDLLYAVQVVAVREMLFHHY